MSDEAFWGAVRSVVKREIIRKAKGTENVDNVYTISSIGEKMIDDLVNAFKPNPEEDKKINVPGLAAHEASGKCLMNWYALACFVRFYASDFVTGEMRDHILQQLNSGVTAQELIDDEIVGVNWYFCEDPNLVPEDEKNYCCPAEILDDWYYQELTQGKVPQVSPGGTSWLTVGLLGLGVFAVAMTIRAVSQHAQPNPSMNTIPVPSSGKTRKERDAIRAKVLRLNTARKHPFEEWDELREGLYSGDRIVSGYGWETFEDLHDLVESLRSIGIKTTDKTEAEWMLNLSAGVS